MTTSSIVMPSTLKVLGHQVASLMVAIGVVALDRFLRVLFYPESPLTKNPAAGLLVLPVIDNIWISLLFFLIVNPRALVNRFPHAKWVDIVLPSFFAVGLTLVFSCYLAILRP